MSLVVVEVDYTQVAIGLAWLAIVIILAAGGAARFWRLVRDGGSA